MASSTPESQAEYLLAVLKNATEFKANYRDLAQHMGVNNANNAQKRFKSIVEQSGTYKLVNGKVVDTNEASSSAATSVTAPATPKKRKAKITDDATSTHAKPAAKRGRKRAATPGPMAERDNENDEATQDDEEGSGDESA